MCEDEIQYVNQIKSILDREKKNWKLEVFHTKEELEQRLEQEEYTLYLLDIHLSNKPNEEHNARNGEGYQLAKEIRKKKPKATIIFFSSHGEYSFDAFEVEALRFLKKPLDEAKVLEAFNKVEELYEVKESIFRFTKDGVNYCKQLEDIYYFERKQRMIELCLETENIQFYGSLKDIENSLKHQNFCRTHQGFLINLDYVDQVLESVVVLKNRISIPLARGRKEKVYTAYAEYCWKRGG